MNTKISFLFSIILSVSLIISFSACSDDDDDDPTPKIVDYQGFWKSEIDAKSFVNFTVGNVNDNSWIIAYSFNIVAQSGSSTVTVSGNEESSAGIVQINGKSFQINLETQKDGVEQYIEGTFTSLSSCSGSIKVKTSAGDSFISKSFTAELQ